MHFLQNAIKTYQKCDGNEGKDQHVEDEKSLAPLSGRIDLVAPNPPRDLPLNIDFSSSFLVLVSAEFKDMSKRLYMSCRSGSDARFHILSNVLGRHV